MTCKRIVEYIARDDPAAAQRFGLLLIERSESLVRAPEAGVRLVERPGARFLPCGSYLSFTVRMQTAARYGFSVSGTDRDENDRSVRTAMNSISAGVSEPN